MSYMQGAVFQCLDLRCATLDPYLDDPFVGANIPNSFVI